MNRQKILIAACVLASISIGTNIWLLSRKKDEPAPGSAAKEEKPAPTLPTAAEFDFNGTAFEDGSWKLDDRSTKGKEAPVFGGTALVDESWKLGGGKESDKEKHPSGPPKSESPPAAPAPQGKSASSGPEIRTSGSGPTPWEEELWNLSKLTAPAVEWDKPFSFEEFTLRQQQAMGNILERVDESYTRNSRGPADDNTFTANQGDRLRDTASSVPVFERRFLGGANNLRGWNYTEAGPR
jgi:hypothetical protein